MVWKYFMPFLVAGINSLIRVHSSCLQRFFRKQLSWPSLDGQFQKQRKGEGGLHVYLPKPEIPSPTLQSQEGFILPVPSHWFAPRNRLQNPVSIH